MKTPLTHDQKMELVIEVSDRLGLAIPDVREFAALLLENANDHELGNAIQAVKAGDYELAQAFLKPDLPRSCRIALSRQLPPLHPEGNRKPKSWPKSSGR